jgi:hypothetical protein
MNLKSGKTLNSRSPTPTLNILNYEDEEENMDMPTLNPTSDKIIKLDKSTYKKWLEDVLDYIRQYELASYVSKDFYTNTLGCTDDDYNNHVNPTYDPAKSYEGPDKAKKAEVTRKKGLYNIIHTTAIKSLSDQDLQNLKDEYLPGQITQLTSKITIEQIVNFVTLNYATTSLAQKMDYQTKFISTGIPVPQSLSIDEAMNTFNNVLAQFKQTNYSGVPIAEIQQQLTALLLSKLAITDDDLRAQINVKLGTNNKPTYEQLIAAIKDGYQMFIALHPSKCMPTPIALANAVKKSQKKPYNNKGNLNFKTGKPCPLPNHHHPIAECKEIKRLLRNAFVTQKILSFITNANTTKSPNRRALASAEDIEINEFDERIDENQLYDAIANCMEFTSNDEEDSEQPVLEFIEPDAEES